MRAFRFWPAAAAIGLLASCGLGAPAYPTFGNTDYRVEGFATTPQGQTVPTVIYRDGPKMRVETVVGNNQHAVIVFDQATNAAYVLTPTAAPTAPQTATTVTSAASPNGQQTVTTAVSTPPPSILGVATRVAGEDAPKPLEASWASLGADHARSVGSCTAANTNGHEWQPRDDSAGVERTACITDDGVVLRLKEGNRTLFEATKLDRGPQSPALFGVPPGYQVIDPTTVAQQVGNTMQHLDSVTGSGATPGASPNAAPPAPQPPHG
jgi:hypothetical protein